MKRFMTCLALAGAVALGAGSAWGQDPPHGDAHKGATVALNAAAEAAVKAAFPKATAGKVGLVGKEGNKLFTVAMSEGEKKFHVEVSDSGVIVRVMTPVGDLSTLPKAVTDAVNAASEGAKITSAAKVEQRADPKTHTALDKAKVSYELRFTGKDGARNSMDVAEDGAVIRAPKAPRTEPPKEKPALPA